MAVDQVARALAKQALDNHIPMLTDFGGGPDASSTQNRAAFRDAFASGISALALSAGEHACALISVTDPVSSATSGLQPNVILPKGFRTFDGRKAHLSFSDGRGIQASGWTTWGYPYQSSDVVQPVTAGATQVTLAAGEGANWAPGDSLLWRFGSLPYDKPETLNWGIAKVRAVSGDIVTLDCPMIEDFDPASVDNDSFNSNFDTTWYNRTLHKWPIFEDLEIHDLTGEGVGSYRTEELITVRGGQRISIRRCGAYNIGIGFSMQFVEGAVIEDCHVVDPDFFKASVGKGMNLAECRDVAIRNFQCRGARTGIALEAGSDAQVVGGIFENTGNPATGASYGQDCLVFSVLGRSTLTVRDYTVTGYGGYVLSSLKNADPDYDGTIDFTGRITMIHPTEPALFNPVNFSGQLDYRIAGNRELFDFRDLRVWRRRVWLRNGLYQNLRGPSGILVSARIYASESLEIGGTGLTGLYIGRDNINGANFMDELVPGSEKTITFPGGTAGGVLWTNRDKQVKFLIVTPSGTNLNTADEYIDIECTIAPDRLAPEQDWSLESDQRNSGPGGGQREALFAAYDLPSIAAGSTYTADLSIPDMANSDFVEAFEFTGNIGSISIRHIEALSGAVRVIFENQTGAAIDLGATDLRVLWRKSITSG